MMNDVGGKTAPLSDDFQLYTNNPGIAQFMCYTYYKLPFDPPPIAFSYTLTAAAAAACSSWYL